jgi:hypothetical protein
MRRLRLAATALLFVSAIARAESTGEMLSDCRPWANAQLVQEGIKAPAGAGPQRCWGAFGVIQFGVMLMNPDKSRAWMACVPENAVRRSRS